MSSPLRGFIRTHSSGPPSTSSEDGHGDVAVPALGGVGEGDGHRRSRGLGRAVLTRGEGRCADRRDRRDHDERAECPSGGASTHGTSTLLQPLLERRVRRATRGGQVEAILEVHDVSPLSAD